MHSVYESPHKDRDRGICVSYFYCSHIHVEMDEGDVMSGIDRLHRLHRHNDDVIHRRKIRKNMFFCVCKFLVV